jgi:hypothetical protein
MAYPMLFPDKYREHFKLFFIQEPGNYTAEPIDTSYSPESPPMKRATVVF